MTDVSRRTILAAGTALTIAGSANRTFAAPKVDRPSEHDAIPLLDEKQTGQLRHFRNIAQQLPNDFTFMQGTDPDQIDDYSNYRFQLSPMMIAFALTLQHHTPAAQGVYAADYRRLMTKLLQRETWNYWSEVSRYSPETPPPGITKGQGWWDPIIKGNIFYSGPLIAGAAQYAWFFNDDRYDAPDAFRFERSPFAPGPKAVEYSLKSAADQVYWQLVEKGFMGVACLPDMLFNSCPQFAINAFRFQDLRHGTSRAEEVVVAHKRAWERYGGYAAGKPMPCMLKESTGEIVNVPWGLGYYIFNTWNPEYFRSTYAMTRATNVLETNRRLEVYGVKQWGDTQAAFLAGTRPPPVEKTSMGGQAVAGPYGTISVMMSEAGDSSAHRLIEQADASMNPQWVNGGYHYPRNDADWDSDGNVVGVTATTTASLAVARLNPNDGLRALFANPLPVSRWQEPYIADASREIDVPRATFLAAQNKLVIALRPQYGAGLTPTRLALANVNRQGQSWTLTIDGHTAARGTASGQIVGSKGHGQTAWEGDKLVISLPVSRLTNLVMSWT